MPAPPDVDCHRAPAANGSCHRPWPFTGRGEELALVRRQLAAGRRGIAVTGAPGCGKTRLAAEAVRGMPHTLVTGTAAARSMLFAAFAHVLPGSVSLHRAAELLRGVRVLVVDDAHLLDDASAALVHLLAVHGPARLLVLARPDRGAPDAVSRLWTADLLPALPLGPLPAQDASAVLGAVLGGPADPLTARRLHRVSRGDLWLLRELATAAAASGRLRREHGAWTWRGPLPATPRARELALAGLRPKDRAALDLVARAEPLPADRLPAPARERLAERGAIGVDGRGLAWLTDGLYGYGAGADRLRVNPGARGDRLRMNLGAEGDRPHTSHGARGDQLHTSLGAEGDQLHTTDGARGDQFHTSLDADGDQLHTTDSARAQQLHAHLAAECEQLEERVRAGEVFGSVAGAGRRLVEDDAGAGEPLLSRYCAARASLCRLRGELREAVAWSREGLRSGPDDAGCRRELAHAAAYLGDLATARRALAGHPAPGPARVWLLAAEGSIAAALGSVAGGAAHGDAFAAHDAVRLGAPALTFDRLRRRPGDLAALLTAHATALSDQDGPALDRAASALQDHGLLLHAAEAHAQASRCHRDRRTAEAARHRAATLARGARTPALADLSFGGLTARQRQIASLAADGLTNRQIAEQLSLSVRTVGNHLYSAYARLGSSDRTALGGYAVAEG